MVMMQIRQKFIYMKKSVFIFFVLVFISSSLSAKSNTDSLEIKFFGKIISTNVNYKVSYAHVINLNTNKGVISDSLGSFSLKMQDTDTLRITCLGFKTKKITIPDTIHSKHYFLLIEMEVNSYPLSNVNVLSLTSKSQFAYDFKHIPIDLKALEPEIVIPGVTNPNYRKLRAAERPIYPTYIGGSMKFLAKMQKKHKSLEKLTKLVKQDELLAKSADKYNLEILSTISNYKNDTLLAFFAFLKFTPEYIYNTNIYDLYKKIRSKQKLFEAEIKKNGIPDFFKK